MIPLVSTEAEIKIMKDLVIKTARKVQSEHKTKIDFLVGTMIELPRAAIKANDIAKHAEFFSFGTNDLTQTTFGISRDDSGKFLNDYIENKIFDIDPFISIDDGVGDLIQIASEKGKKQNKKIKLVYVENMEVTQKVYIYVQKLVSIMFLVHLIEFRLLDLLLLKLN